MRQKAECDDDIPALVESSLSSTARRKNWARLIRKIYVVDPLLCSKRHGAMHIIAFIEEQPVIRKILLHLGLWETRDHDPPKAHADPLWNRVHHRHHLFAIAADGKLGPIMTPLACTRSRFVNELRPDSGQNRYYSPISVKLGGYLPTASRTCTCQYPVPYSMLYGTGH
jgi:hypothetical protein